MFRPSILFTWVLALFGAAACTTSYEKPGTWVQVPGSGDGITIHTFESGALPVNAWYAHVDTDYPGIDVAVVVPRDPDGRASASDLARENGACLLVNGGYFRMDVTPTTHVGLLLSEGRLLNGPTTGVFRDGVRYEVARSAIGFGRDNRPSVGWVTSAGDSLVWLSTPVANVPGTPGAPPVDSLFRRWDVYDAVSGGPRLLTGGTMDIATEAEVFFGTSIPNIHPRTAAGITQEGDLILMVVDGRQSGSRGVSLEELAELMRSAGAVDAVNLDGGGSSTMISGDALVNLPTGGTFEREVASAIAVRCAGAGTSAP